MMKKIGLDSKGGARPTGKQLSKALKYFDLGVKLEVTLHEVSSLLMNISLAELAVFIIAAVFATKATMKMLWMFTFHFLRGILGILLHNQLPTSH